VGALELPRIYRQVVVFFLAILVVDVALSSGAANANVRMVGQRNPRGYVQFTWSAPSMSRSGKSRPGLPGLPHFEGSWPQFMSMCVVCVFKMQTHLRLLFSATLGEEPEVELALV
jgi:hypothetical protein